MTPRRLQALALAASGLVALGPGACPQGRADAPYALVCGGPELLGIDFGDRGTPARPQVTWRWNAQRDAPAELRRRLGDFNVCQLARHDGELHVLACNPGADRYEDACAMIRVRDKALRWYTDRPANPHAIARVAHDGAARIVVAAAREDSDDDNRLTIHALDAAGTELSFVDLEPFATGRYDTAPKGLAWDPDRSVLYSVDHYAVRAWRPLRWASRSPGLELLWSEPLMGRDSGGHDIVLVPGRAAVYVASNERAAVLDVTTRRWEPDPDWGDGRSTRLKGVDWHASGRRALGRKQQSMISGSGAPQRLAVAGPIRQIRLSSEAIR